MLRAQAGRVSAWLDAHDWIGVYGWPDGDTEPGEYSGMVWPLIALLRDDAGPDAIASYLETDLREHFGFGDDVEDQRPVADRLYLWWSQEGEETQSLSAWEQVLEPVLAGALAQLDLLDPRARPLLAAYWLTGPDAGPAVAELAGQRGDDPAEQLWAAALAEQGVATPVVQARRLALPWLSRLIVSGRSEAAAVAALANRLDEPADPPVDELLHELSHTLDVASEMLPDPGPDAKRSWLPWRRRSARARQEVRRDADVRIAVLLELLAFGELDDAVLLSRGNRGASKGGSSPSS